MHTLELDATATVGDTVYLAGRTWTISETVWPDGWRLWIDLSPIETDLLDAMAPYAFRLPSRQLAPASIYPRGIFHGAARLETTGRAIVRKNGAAWLRCRIELWNGETTQRLRGLVCLK
jgi:hypothetical protein